MSIRDFEIDKDIRRASTLPAPVYSDPAYLELQKDRVFARSWQYAGEASRIKAPGRVAPFTLLDGCLNEPLVLTSDDEGTVRCLSNVCTHRGAIVVEGEGHARNLRCRYHGRRFALDGKFVSMPAPAEVRADALYGAGSRDGFQGMDRAGVRARVIHAAR